jgi:hypothetical protein
VYRVLGVKCLFIYLFNSAISNSDYAASNDFIMVNNELERTWKKTVVVHLK